MVIGMVAHIGIPPLRSEQSTRQIIFRASGYAEALRPAYWHNHIAWCAIGIQCLTVRYGRVLDVSSHAGRHRTRVWIASCDSASPFDVLSSAAAEASERNEGEAWPSRTSLCVSLPLTAAEIPSWPL